MFQLTLPQLLVVYVFLILGGLFVLWLGGEVQRWVRLHRIQRSRMVCGVCGCHYEDHTEDPLPRCPECGRANERQSVRTV